MREQFIRTEMLLGAEALERLQNARVALFGLGGVGGSSASAPSSISVRINCSRMFASSPKV